jgi:hypothetical protein
MEYILEIQKKKIELKINQGILKILDLRRSFVRLLGKVL